MLPRVYTRVVWTNFAQHRKFMYHFTPFYKLLYEFAQNGQVVVSPVLIPLSTNFLVASVLSEEVIFCMTLVYVNFSVLSSFLPCLLHVYTYHNTFAR
jgi:hypothetical protein